MMRKLELFSLLRRRTKENNFDEGGTIFFHDNFLIFASAMSERNIPSVCSFQTSRRRQFGNRT